MVFGFCVVFDYCNNYFTRPQSRDLLAHVALRYSATVLQLVLEVYISQCAIYKISNSQILDKHKITINSDSGFC